MRTQHNGSPHARTQKLPHCNLPDTLGLALATASSNATAHFWALNLL